MKQFLLGWLFISTALPSFAQSGHFSGSVQTNTNVFFRDTLINTAKFYETTKVGADAWMNLNYSNDKYGLDAGVRLDVFLNSIVRNPTAPFTGVGLGSFFIRKQIGDLTATGGYIYDQIGTGIIFRTYEERPLGIDNALVGMKLNYNVKNLVNLKAFAGVQKNQFTFYKAVIAGFNAEGNFSIKDKVKLQPGIGVVNRYMDKDAFDKLYSTLQAYDSTTRFKPVYNAYAFSIYNTLTIGKVSIYAEAAFKSREAINGKVFNDSTHAVTDRLVNVPGSVIYASLNYSTKGFGFTASFKRTDNFSFRTSPNERLFNGMISFIPPLSRQNSLRLPARYFAPSQEVRELAFASEITYSPNKKWTFIANGSYVRDFLFKPWNTVITQTTNGVTSTKPYHTFFGECYLSAAYRPSRKTEIELGFQYVRYNRLVYLGDGAQDMDVFTPFLEVMQRIGKKKSLRFEFQYQHISHVDPADSKKRKATDFGQWVFLLAEFNIAPSWSFAVSDMWNFLPSENSPNHINYFNDLEAKSGTAKSLFAISRNHYPSVFVAYTYHQHRFTLSYSKNVAGIVCTGGVCRFEPAFSGIKFTVNTNF
ncbi:MAG: DUF6029 family protein [Chitinophagales bacterium]